MLATIIYASSFDMSSAKALIVWHELALSTITLQPTKLLTLKMLHQATLFRVIDITEEDT